VWGRKRGQRQGQGKVEVRSELCISPARAGVAAAKRKRAANRAAVTWRLFMLLFGFLVALFYKMYLMYEYRGVW
jgi:hypothetical protein